MKPTSPALIPNSFQCLSQYVENVIIILINSLESRSSFIISKMSLYFDELYKSIYDFTRHRT